MGNNNSMGCAPFSDDEIDRLAKRFQKLDVDYSGTISVEEFMKLPEVKKNPLAQRIFEVFDDDCSGDIDFKEFLHGIAQLSEKGGMENKLKFAFKMYDVDQDGFISNEDLCSILKIMVGNNLSPTQLQQVVDKTMLKAGKKDASGKLSYEEFVRLVENVEMKWGDDGGKSI